MLPDIPADQTALARRLAEVEAELVVAREDAATWRRAALERWSEALGDTLATGGGELSGLRGQIEEIHRSASWRVTRPLRVASRGVRAIRSRR